MVDLGRLMGVRDALAAFRQELAGTEARIEELLTQRQQLDTDLDAVQRQREQLIRQEGELRERGEALLSQRDALDVELAHIETLNQALGLPPVPPPSRIENGPTAPPSLGGRRRSKVAAQLTHDQLRELVLQQLPPTTEPALATPQLYKKLEPLGVALDYAGKKRLQNMLRRMTQDGRVIARKEAGSQNCLYHRNSSDPVVEAAAFVPPAPPAPADHGQFVAAVLDDLYDDMSAAEQPPENS